MDLETAPPTTPDSWWYTLHIDTQPWMIGLVRDSLRTALHRSGQDELADTAALLASEVASNGVVHSGLPVTVRMRWRYGRLRVAVHDRSPAVPKQRTPEDDEEGGRGLLLVESCATRWGVWTCRSGACKEVWFELR